MLAACTADASEEGGDRLQRPDSGQAAGAAEEGASEAPDEYLDELHSETLHESVTPAAPGTAYVEVAGERFEFESLNCTGNDEPGRGQFIVVASGETTASGHQLFLHRQIGADIGFHFEDEYVQLALLVEESGEAKMNNSMAQHEREQGEPPVWVRGSGTHPLVRVVGQQATATGVLEGVPFAPNPEEAEFVAAATCP